MSNLESMPFTCLDSEPCLRLCVHFLFASCSLPPLCLGRNISGVIEFICLLIYFLVGPLEGATAAASSVPFSLLFSRTGAECCRYQRSWELNMCRSRMPRHSEGRNPSYTNLHLLLSPLRSSKNYTQRLRALSSTLRNGLFVERVLFILCFF